MRRAVRKLYRCSSFVDYGSLRLDQPSSFSANFDRFSLVSSPSHFLGPPVFFLKLTSTGCSARIEELLDIPVSWAPWLHMDVEDLKYVKLE